MSSLAILTLVTAWIASVHSGKPILTPDGDMSDFSIPEDTSVGSVVYTLKGLDPEGSPVTYTISGDHFSVNRNTGVVTLRQKLDREIEPVLEVVITVQDEAYEHLVPFRRVIRVLDVNDNVPTFDLQGSPYRVAIDETVEIGQSIFSSIVVKDEDEGLNAEIVLRCDSQRTPEACRTFEVKAQRLEAGSYLGLVSVKEALDYESRSSYTMRIVAEDSGQPRSLASYTDLFIEVKDVQDQAPHFINSPYSATVPENTFPGTKIFDIKVRDGDTGTPRKLRLDLIGDSQNFFVLEQPGVQGPDGVLTAALETSENPIDREMESILAAGGLYTFQILAQELIDDSGQIGDQTVTNVTIVITDRDDEIPTFNKESFTVAIPEEVGPDTPLPDLNIIVTDADVSTNAEFELVLETTGPFSVYPTRAVGRTPVILRVSNPDLLDYEEDDKRNYVVKINAMQGGKILSSCTVNVLVTDSNDNAPVFERALYNFNVKEDAPAGELVGSIVAEDLDSGSFGQVEYDLRGFGAEKFRVNRETGDIFVNSCVSGIGFPDGDKTSCLDHESQDSYSLTYTGTDGGDQVTTTSVMIRIIDVNDNYPKFIGKGDYYERTVDEGDTSFDSKLVIEATDNDGVTQGGDKVFYSIESINTDATIFDIDPVTGEISILQPIPSIDDPGFPADGHYDLVIRATDSGKPPLHSDVNVKINISTIRNLKPEFLQSYKATVDENASSGTKVVKVKARDLDGPDNELRYKLHSGDKDNFVIDEVTGEISVSKDAVLDIQENGDQYEIIVRVTDKGTPYEQFGETSVSISINDINDKPPKFEKNSYSTFVNERKSIGETVLKVSATDDDRNADLEYDIIDPISAIDKAGNALTNTASYDFTSAFNIDPRTGNIFVNEPLSYNFAAVIILTVKVTDKNAVFEVSEEEEEEPKNPQVDTVEVTIYIQAFKANSPQFASPWTPSDPTISVNVKEGLPIGTSLFKLNAHDPTTGLPVTRFEKSELSDPENIISVDTETGTVFNNAILDFEKMTEFTFSVRAVVPGIESEDRISEATVHLMIKDINDNAPIFESPEYRTEINESALPLTPVISVKAYDADSGDFGKIIYELSGEGIDAFSIHPTEGHILIKAGVGGRSNVDREKIPEYRLTVLAKDDPPKTADQKTSSATVLITVLDDNDTPPKFSESRYSAVVPENSPIGTPVVTVKATDDDLGQAGEVSYAFADKVNDKIYEIDEITGQITTAKLLTGKGRHTPYVLLVRAVDHGDPGLFTDTEVYVTIGDVSSNDGIPTFTRPLVDEIAYVAENSSPGTKVFQVVASDPDDPDTANGKIVYTLPDDGTIIRKLFQIDPVNGVLTTKMKLDREERQNYTLILDVKDLGTPPQQTSRTLTVVVKDVDDHAPVFERQKNSLPLEVVMDEEGPVGTEVATVKGIDLDEGDNARIGYAIIDGNEEGIFRLIETEDTNEGKIVLEKKLDRESHASHILTVKCFRPYERNVKSQRKKYDSSQLDEIQVKVQVQDIDDNPPVFMNRNKTYGVRSNAALYTEVAQLVAMDIDADAKPIQYEIINITYFRPRTGLTDILNKNAFIIDQENGVLQTNRTLGRFAEGHFIIFVKAQNMAQKLDLLKVKIYVLQDTELMRFVFDRDPTFVRQKLPKFKAEVEAAISQPLKFNIFDTEFYSKGDGSLDFGRTSSCFQLLDLKKGETLIDLHSSEKILNDNEDSLKDLLEKYNVIDVERCSRIHTTSKMQLSWVEVVLLIIGVMIGLFAIIASFAVCCLYSRYKQNLYRHSPIKIVEAPVRAYIPTSLPPGSIIHGNIPTSPSIAGSDGRILYDSWHQQETIPADLASYRSLPNH